MWSEYQSFKPFEMAKASFSLLTMLTAICSSANGMTPMFLHHMVAMYNILFYVWVSFGSHDRILCIANTKIVIFYVIYCGIFGGKPVNKIVITC